MCCRSRARYPTCRATCSGSHHRCHKGCQRTQCYASSACGTCSQASPAFACNSRQNPNVPSATSSAELALTQYIAQLNEKVMSTERQLQQETQVRSSSFNAPTAELPLAIPTETQSLASGFTYHPALARHGITATAWETFNTQFTAAAKLTPRQVAKLVSCVAPLYAFGFGLHGCLVGKAVSQRAGVRNAAGSGITDVLRRWNDQSIGAFGVNGLDVQLLVPEAKMPTSYLSQEGRRWLKGDRSRTQFRLVIARKGHVEEKEALQADTTSDEEPPAYDEAVEPDVAEDEKNEVEMRMEDVVHPLLR